jgi:hypothetical protein
MGALVYPGWGWAQAVKVSAAALEERVSVKAWG